MNVPIQENHSGKILILATESCAYPCANAVGQAHNTYASNTYVLKVRAPVMFPEWFYLECFHKGIGGVIAMACGEECPYEGAYTALSQRIDGVFARMKEENLDIRRLKLSAVCTVCIRAFLKDIQEMNTVLQELGPPPSRARQLN